MIFETRLLSRKLKKKNRLTMMNEAEQIIVNWQQRKSNYRQTNHSHRSLLIWSLVILTIAHLPNGKSHLLSCSSKWAMDIDVLHRRAGKNREYIFFDSFLKWNILPPALDIDVEFYLHDFFFICRRCGWHGCVLVCRHDRSIRLIQQHISKN